MNLALIILASLPSCGGKLYQKQAAQGAGAPAAGAGHAHLPAGAPARCSEYSLPDDWPEIYLYYPCRVVDLARKYFRSPQAGW